ncbi:response regulator transcription factor [Rhizobium sp. C4]|uniref:response regulator transcription factor n=1 Tax=Rhizobium sp. C4 TaxID=1349800 RepID=UPI001E4C77D5|nr:LuxR C-terminal-related transcriptional regulator [Rhizobium sp. C4]MCD2172796.1 LuxR C-terminal-related transcriptional regulator [Rhizobium sp. C4]
MSLNLTDDGIEAELNRAINRTDFFRVFRMLADRYGFLSFTVFELTGMKVEPRLDRICLLADLPNGRSSLCEIVPEESQALLDELASLRRPAFLPAPPKALAPFMACRRAVMIPMTAQTGERLVLVLADDLETRPEADVAGAVFDFLQALQKLAVAEGLDADTPRFRKREIEVVEWTAEGKTSSEIALLLGLSEYTVNEYIGSAMRKLEALNRIHLVTKAIRVGIIS